VADEESIKVRFELSGVDKAKLEVADFEKSLNGAQKAVVALAKADAQSGAALKAMEEGLAAGTVSAEEYVAALKAIADQAPKTAAQVRATAAEAQRAAAREESAAKATQRAEEAKAKAAERAASAAEREAQRAAAAAAKKAEAAKKAADAEAEAALAAAAAVAEAEEAKTKAAQKHADDVRRIEEAKARDARATRPGLNDRLEARGLSAGGLAGAFAATTGVVAAFTVGTLAAANATAEAAGRSERHARALHALGDTYRLVQAATNDTLSAEDAYRAQLDLTRSGLRVSGEEFALVTRYAREHKGALETNEEALQQLTEALRNGESEGLRKFGISTQSGATRAQTFERALRQMDRATKDVTPSTRTLAEEQERASRAFGEGVDALGRLAAHALGLPETMSQVADAIRDVVGAVNDMIEAEQRLPQQRAQQERRQRAQASYAQSLRATGQQLDSLGLDRSILPAADTANRLTPEQLEAADARLRTLQARLSTRGRERAAEFGDGARLAPSAPRSTGEVAQFGAFTRAPTLDDLNAEGAAFEAGQRARRGERRGGIFARTAADRAEAEAALRDLAGDLARQTAANTTTRPTRPGPRDSAPTGTDAAPKNIVGILMEQATGAGVGAQGVGSGTVAQELRRIGVIGAPERNPDLGANLFNGPVRQRGGGQGAAGDAVDEGLAAQAQARYRRQLDERLDAQRTFTDRWEELHHRQANASRMAADAGTEAFELFGKALGQHAVAAAKGAEAVDVALQGTVSDTLTAVGTQAIIKGAMEIAEGTAALAGIVTAAAAPGHFIAGAAFLGVGALATSLGGAVAPAPSAPSGAGGSAPSAPIGATSSTSDEAKREPTRIEINLGGGVVIGQARDLGEALARVINDPNAGVIINSGRVQGVRRAA